MDLVLKVMFAGFLLVVIVRYPQARKLAWISLTAFVSTLLLLGSLAILALPVIAGGFIVLLVFLGKHDARSTALGLDALDD